MRKRKSVILAMVLAVACATFVLGLNGTSGAKEYRTAPGLLTGCELYQAFSSFNEAWREGRITERELVLKKAKVYYDDRQALHFNCDEEVLDLLKHELLEDVYRLAEELRPSDRTYLTSLNIELAEALDRGPDGIGEMRARATDEADNVFDRISVAVNDGRLSPKEAVLLKAKLIYAPHLLPEDSEFAPVSGKPAGEECDTGFYRDLHRVKDLLTGQEKALLRSFSPDFDAIVRSWRQVAPSALPDFPQLDKKFRGKKCVIHYTLAGDHAVPNAKYPSWVASYIDEAIADETAAGHFRAAYAEGGGKLHVYCVKMGANGVWVDVSDVAGSGKRKSGYIKISSRIKKAFGATWKAKLAGVAYHEYFHGVQSAYNWESDLWFMEATSVWASCYYGNDYQHVGSYYTAADSIFNKPNDNLWLTTYRKYSTSALAFFLAGKYGRHKIIKEYFENSETEDDAVTILKTTLAAKTGSPAFGDVFKEFLLRMYSKKIAGVKSYLPDVKLEATHNNYGVPLTDGNVMLLGANFYKLDKPANAILSEAPLIAVLEKGATGNPQGVLAKKGGIAPSAVQDGRSYIPLAVEAVFIAVDVDYSGKDVAGRPYKYTAITPHVAINEVTADSPIQSGYSSNIHIMYNLLGTVAGEPFWTTLKVVEKGPDVADNVSGDFNLPIGNNQDLHLYFNTSTETEGTYSFKFQLKVPIDSWKIPQVKGTGSCTVVVEKPPESTSIRPRAGTSRGGALEIRR